MKQFVSLINKEFWHIFRDQRTMLVLLGMPIAQIIIFGFAITTEVRNVPISIVDYSHSSLSRNLINHLGHNPYFNIISINKGDETPSNIFENTNSDILLVIDENLNRDIVRYGKGNIQAIVDASDPNVALTEISYLSQAIQNNQSSIIQTKSNAKPFGITPNIHMLYNPQMKSTYNFVPGVMGVIFMLICAMMTSVSIVREKETGTMELLLSTPVNPLAIIFSKAIPYLALSLVNLLTILMLSTFVLHVPIAGSLFLLVALSILYICVCLALGLLISSIAQSQLVAMLVSGVLLMMPALLLSGMIFPIENMPDILRYISSIIPARWYIFAVKKVMIEGSSVLYIARELAILSIMLVIFATLSIKKFKLRIE